MSSIIVCGGGVIGLASAVMLARDGRQVTVLEIDPDPAPATPERAWTSWRRARVAQFHQPHILLARFGQVCDEELPGVTDQLLAAGCVWVDYLASLPPTLSDHDPRPGDDRLRFVTGRRPVVEAVFAAAAEQQQGVTVRRGVRVAELLTGPAAIPGVPHVAGVRTTAGEELRADLVVDATGRRSPSSDWLAGLGAQPPHVASEDLGFVYYSRFFTGPARPRRMGPALVALGSVSLLTLDGDNDTWSVTVFGTSRDIALKALRDPAVFTRVVQACPLQAHWLDGTPITEVLPMAGVLDRYRRFVVDGRPVVTGFAAVGDAWACTNPSAGRGLSIGIVHAQLLRHLVREHLDDPAGFARAFDDHTERVVAPFYRNQVAADRARIAEMTALRAGVEPPAPNPSTARFLAAAGYDADAFRGLLETVMCLAQPHEVLAWPAVRAAIDRQPALAGPAPVPGPDRSALVRLLAA